MGLQPDDTVCFCFHVSLRKIENYCRQERPQVPSQISQCLSAGTGCGWCRPMIRHIHARICPRPDASAADPSLHTIDPAADAQAYAEGRAGYLKKKP
jgi:bacterioferritin-associated ferredoxin